MITQEKHPSGRKIPWDPYASTITIFFNITAPTQNTVNIPVSLDLGHRSYENECLFCFVC